MTTPDALVCVRHSSSLLTACPRFIPQCTCRLWGPLGSAAPAVTAAVDRPSGQCSVTIRRVYSVTVIRMA
jgi:hypothetical protein